MATSFALHVVRLGAATTKLVPKLAAVANARSATAIHATVATAAEAAAAIPTTRKDAARRKDAAKTKHPLLLFLQ